MSSKTQIRPWNIFDFGCFFGLDSAWKHSRMIDLSFLASKNHVLSKKFLKFANSTLMGLVHGHPACSSPRLRPYHVENTPSRPIWQVKQRWARLVLGSETSWDFSGVLSFLPFPKNFLVLFLRFLAPIRQVHIFPTFSDHF